MIADIRTRVTTQPNTMRPARYAGLVLNLAQRQLKLRYRRSVLGWLWSLIIPLSTLVTYIVVFGVFLAVRPPLAGNGQLRSYALFLFSGLFVWNLFFTVVTSSMVWMLDLGPLLKQIPFPAEAPLLAGTVAALVQAATELALLIVIFAVEGNLSISYLLLPIPLLLVALFALGIGLVAALTNVYLRDVENLVRVGMTILFYGTTIVYPLSVVPTRLWGRVPIRAIVEWNPLTRLVDVIRGILYGLQTPSLAEVTLLVALCGATFVIGLRIFKQFGSTLGEEL